jgi:nucleoside-diphosphate-sugar epimerase
MSNAEVVVLARDPVSARQILGEQVNVLRGDFRDVASLREAFRGVDVLYHIGARRDHWGLPRREYLDSNVLGTQNVLEAAESAGIPKIVYCSSVGVYGYDFQYLPVDEAHPFGTRLSYYHESKRLAEEIVLSSKLPIITVRPGWIYGPNDDNGGVTQMLIKLARRRFAFVGKGGNRIHPVYIDDVVDGIIAAGRSEEYGEAFLLLGPEPLTFEEYVQAMCRALEISAPTLRIPFVVGRLSSYGLEPLWLAKNRILGKKLLGDKPPMTRDTLAGISADRFYDTSKAQRLLGHAPSVGVDEGLGRTVEWLASIGRLPQGIPTRLSMKEPERQPEVRPQP